MSDTIYTYPKKHHYTYLLEYKNGMLYHGVRSCDVDINNDEYYGSSDYTPVELPTKKTILTTHKTREEAIDEEIRYHAEVDVKRHPQYYNKSNQTSTGFDFDCSREIEINGVLYRSNNAASEAIGIHQNTVKKLVKKNGSRYGINYTPLPRTSLKEIEINGVLFESDEAAAEALGVCTGSIYKWAKKNESRYGIIY